MQEQVTASGGRGTAPLPAQCQGADGSLQLGSRGHSGPLCEKLRGGSLARRPGFERKLCHSLAGQP